MTPTQFTASSLILGMAKSAADAAPALTSPAAELFKLQVGSNAGAGALLGSVGGGLYGYLGTRDQSKKKKVINGMLGALVGGAGGTLVGGAYGANKGFNDMRDSSVRELERANNALPGRAADTFNRWTGQPTAKEKINKLKTMTLLKLLFNPTALEQ
jgi:hypothetical protein